jgi:cytoskeleton protein RodZ
MAVEASNVQSDAAPGSVPAERGASAPSRTASAAADGDLVPEAGEAAAPEEPGSKLLGIGERLRAARERKGYSVLQVAERLHMDPHAVENLETENFQPLGATVYVRGHIRRYADLVDEQGVELQDIFSKAMKNAQQPDLRNVPKALQPDDTGKLVVAAIYGAAGLLVVGIIWWVMSLSSRAHPNTVQVGPRHTQSITMESTSSSAVASAPTPTQAEPAASSEPPSPTEPVTAGPAQPQASAASASVTPAPAPVVQQHSASAAPAPAVGSASASAPPVVVASAASRSASASVSATPESAAAMPPTTATPGAQDTQLTLRFSSDSYTEVYDGGGKQLFVDVGSTGSVHTLHGKPPLKVTLYNGPGVSVDVNGHRVAIDFAVRGDGKASFLVLKNGHMLKLNGG